MNIQIHIEERRAELRNCIEPEERMQIANELDIARLPETLQDAIEFKEWAMRELAEPLDNNLTSVIANREAQYTEACKAAADAQDAYEQAIRSK
ncbi:MAG: hypothetical protein ACLP4V_02315 [Methylocella sp.]